MNFEQFPQKSAIQSYLIANTPSHLFTLFRKDQGIQQLANMNSTEELINMLESEDMDNYDFSERRFRLLTISSALM